MINNDLYWSVLELLLFFSPSEQRCALMHMLSSATSSLSRNADRVSTNYVHLVMLQLKKLVLLRKAKDYATGFLAFRYREQPRSQFVPLLQRCDISHSRPTALRSFPCVRPLAVALRIEGFHCLLLHKRHLSTFPGIGTESKPFPMS